MKHIVSPTLIRNYLSGNCTPEEAARLREWYDSFEHEADPIEGLSPQERIALKEMMYSEVIDRIRTHQALPSRRLFSMKGRDAVRTRRVVLAGVAAAILLFAAVIIFVNPQSSPVTLPALVVNDNETGTVPQAGSKNIVVHNALRTIKRQTLSDGSVIWLQPHTWISFPSEFAADKRVVRMSGEAFFEVSRDPGRPFTVYSGDLVTRVLGTSFNIKAYKDGSSAEVSVFTGEVAVSLPQMADAAHGGSEGEQELVLVKHEKAVFVHQKKLLEKTVYSTKKEPELNIWKKNTISFDNTPVKEVVNVLNKEFDVSLQVDENDKELNTYMLKADFTNQNLPDILQMLEKSLNLTYEIEGKEIILKLDK